MAGRVSSSKFIKKSLENVAISLISSQNLCLKKSVFKKELYHPKLNFKANHDKQQENIGLSNTNLEPQY